MTPTSPDGTMPIAILVAGVHRSGTSAVTRTLNLLGARVPGNLMAAAHDNPRGFWESQDIAECHDRFLDAVGLKWDDPRLMPRHLLTSAAAQACRDELLALLRRDMTGAPVFVIKDPRLCRLLPIWAEVLAEFGARPLVVVPVRNPLEVAQSLHRRDGMDLAPAMALWLVDTVMAERDSRGWPRLFVRYDAFLADPMAAAVQLAERLGCLSAEATALAAIGEHWSADLRHHAAPAPDDAVAPSWVRQAYGWLIAATEQEPSDSPFDAIAEALAATLELYGDFIGTLSRAELLRHTKTLHDIIADKDRHLAESHAAAVDLDRRLAESHAAAVALDRRCAELGAKLERRRDAIAALSQTLAKQGAFERQDMEIIARSGRFDTAYYLRTYEEVAAAGMDPIAHYVHSGAQEGRNPNPDFNTVDYIEANPEALLSGRNPFAYALLQELVPLKRKQP